MQNTQLTVIITCKHQKKFEIYIFLTLLELHFLSRLSEQIACVFHINTTN